MISHLKTQTKLKKYSGRTIHEDMMTGSEAILCLLSDFAPTVRISNPEPELIYTL